MFDLRRSNISVTTRIEQLRRLMRAERLRRKRLTGKPARLSDRKMRVMIAELRQLSALPDIH